MPPGTIHAVLGFSASLHVGLRLLSTKDWPKTQALAQECLRCYREALVHAQLFQNRKTESVPPITIWDMRTADNPWEMASYVGEWKTLVRENDGTGDLKEGDTYREIDAGINAIFDELAQHFQDVGICVSTFDDAENPIVNSRLVFFKQYLREEKKWKGLLTKIFPTERQTRRVR
jgi:hypothetical protein